MERDLDDVIRASLEERERHDAPAVPPAEWTAGVLSGVRSRRRRRHAVQGFAAVSGFAILGVAVLLGGRTADGGRVAHPPVPTSTATTAPTQTPSPDPTPSPGPTPSRAPFPDAAAIAAGLGLPATDPVPDSVWDRVGAGWALGVYRPRWDAGDGTDRQLRNTVVLASPAGETYRLLELPADREVDVVGWDPGSTRALVTIAEVQGSSVGPRSRGWLDLRTGRLTVQRGAVGAKVDGTQPELARLLVDGAGDEVWFATYGLTGGGGPATLVVQHPDGTLVRRTELDEGWYGALPAPDGRRLAMPSADVDGRSYDVVDLTTGAVSTRTYGVPRRFCQLVGWRSADTLMATCQATSWEATGFYQRLLEGGQELYDISIHGAAPRLLRVVGSGDPAMSPWSGVPAGGGLVAVGAPPVGSQDGDPCIAGTYLVGPDASTAIGPRGADSVSPAGVADGLLYVEALACRSGDDESAGSAELWASRSDRSTVLLPAPVGGPSALQGGLASWVVAGGPHGRG